jgi:putative ABC transport system ATP-binding protein
MIGKPFIEINNLSRHYRMGKTEISVLHNISFSVEKGEFISILGRSGSGKSTLLNLMGGLDSATSGNILFDGADLNQMKRNDLARHRRITVGMIFQSFNLIHYASALDNVVLALIFGRVPGKIRRDRAVQLLESVGLGDRINHRPSELSGGEAQRVAIARALANQPPVLLADEPTGNLDSITSSEIIGLLKSLNREKGITVLLVTHDQETATAVSDKMIRLKDGRIVENF